MTRVIRIGAEMWDDNGGLRLMMSRYESGEMRFQTIVSFLVRGLAAPYEFTLGGQSNEMKGNLRDKISQV